MGIYTSSTARMYLDHSFGEDNVTVKIETKAVKHHDSSGYTAMLEITSTAPGGHTSKQEVQISMNKNQTEMLANSLTALATKLLESMGEVAQ